jgi:hypothetical protein
MASSGKRKTTMAKLNRERRLLERRMEKRVRKDLRKREAAENRRQLDDGPAGDAAEAPAAEEDHAGSGRLEAPDQDVLPDAEVQQRL